jgi:hypothetical protein
MQIYGTVEAQLRVFSTLGLGEGEWLASRPGRFTPGETDAGTHWVPEPVTSLPLPGIGPRSSSP